MPLPWDKIGKGAVYLWPPKTAEIFLVDSEEFKNWVLNHQKWSRKITSVNLLVLFMWLLLGAWIMGWFPMWVPQPAYAVDLQPLQRENAQLRGEILQLQKQITANDVGLRLGQLTPELDKALERFCLASNAVREGRAPQEMVSLYLGKLRDLEMQYHRLTDGVPYRREPCTAIVIPVSATQ